MLIAKRETGDNERINCGSGQRCMYAYLFVVAFLTRAAHLHSVSGRACNATAECNVFGTKFAGNHSFVTEN